jgi:hypothetical protein
MKTLSSADQAKLDQLIFENRKIEAILLLKNALGLELPRLHDQLLERY